MDRFSNQLHYIVICTIAVPTVIGKYILLNSYTMAFVIARL